MKRINLKIFISILLLVFIREASAQVKMFTNDELPSEHIYQITQDNSGFVWFLTDEGMVKYDGTNLKTFTVADGLPTNAIWNSAVTGDKLWYLCKGAQQGYIRNDSVFNFVLEDGSFMPASYQIKGDEILLNAVYENLYEAKDGKWQMANKSFFKCDGKTGFKNINLSNISHYLTDYKTIDFYNKKQKILSFPINYILISTYNVYDDSLIMLTLDKELHFINANTLKHTKANIPLGENDVLYGTSLRRINGEFQVSYKNFVGILDENYNISEYYQIDPKYDAHANLIDKDGNIWLGSFTTGIHFISKEERYATTKKEENSTYAPVWFEEDVYYVSNGNVETYNANETIISSDEYIYFSAHLDNKLYYYIDQQRSLFEVIEKGKKKTPLYLDGEPASYAPLKILKYNNDYITKGFSQVQVFDQNFHFKRNYPFVNSNIFLVKDSILIATNNGLFYINEKDQIQPTAIKGAVNSLISWNNGLLLGTIGKGLLFHKNGKSTYLSLDNASISKMELYQDSLLFCATNKGVICLKQKGDFFEPYYNYTQKDGLQSIKTNGLAIEDDKNIYITTKKGITKTKIVLPNQVVKKLDQININNIVWGDEKIKQKNNFKILHKIRKNLSIDFSSIYFDVKPKLMYSYRLVGLDEEFIPLKEGQVLLNNLAIGKYELELQVSVPFTENIRKNINFEIKPRWFESKWFHFLIIALGMIFIYLIIKNAIKKKTDKRMQTLEKEAVISNFKLLALRSQMNPHFVFNSLNAIQYYITENQNELSEKYLLSFAKLVRQFFDLSEVGKITLKQEIDLLSNYLGLEKMRFENKIDFKIEIDKKLDINSIEIPSMLLQPIVENAVNHGIFHKESFGTVTLNFIYVEEKEYLVEIQDDGIGIENSKELKAKSMQGHQSKSSQIINERIELLNKTNEWIIGYKTENLTKDSKYPGTKVSLNIKQQA